MQMSMRDMEGAALAVRELELRFEASASPLFHIEALDLAAGASLGISGPSGAGKTSFFHCLAGIQRSTRGSIRWQDGADLDITTLDERARDRWRHRALGLVFQDFHLIEGLSAIDNVLLPASFDTLRIPAALRERAAMLLDRVGIHTGRRTAALLSRGERQRVAIARALLFSPRIVMADEPTASLDPDHRERVADLLLDLVRDSGATLILISHEAHLLERMQRRVRLADGRLAETA